MPDSPGEQLERSSAPSNSEVRAIEVRRRFLPTTVPAGSVAMAAGGVAAGAVAVTMTKVVRSRRRRRLSRKRRKEVQRSVLATRSFLVDVHLLGRSS